MSKAAASPEKRVRFKFSDDGVIDMGAEVDSENTRPPCTCTATSLNKEDERAQIQRGDQEDENKRSNDAYGELLQVFFRDILGITPKPTSDYTEEIKTLRKRFFGMAKDLSSEAGSNSRCDYEQKYPRDRPGKEGADNARVWFTYLDEAETFDRERIEGWKETADVLLVFAGLFSGVITTFVSQASQSLQRDNTQVSASLLFEIAQVLRAQSNGTPINTIPSSTLTPTSPFTPSTNAFLVNGLWFTSLAITLSTALFAVLAKQWLYYYISSITGTANEKVRARQLRFKGFELWKVGAIVDLLPILLHLAVGIFLTGIILLLFPLDICVARIIIVITCITYFLYFVSVILPIRYPECPYTTSLTIYVGILVFFFRAILHWLKKPFVNVFQLTWTRINSEAQHTIRCLLRYVQGVFRYAFNFVFDLIDSVGRGFREFRDTIFTEKSPRITNWREENIKKTIKDATFLDFEALDWLYATSPNRSIHRIIARYVAVNPNIGRHFKIDIVNNLWRALKVNSSNIIDLRYGLCLDSLTHDTYHWRILRSIPHVEDSQLEEEEYQKYSLIADSVIYRNYGLILEKAIEGDFKLPPVMWRYFLEKAAVNDTVDETIAAHILTSEKTGLFEWDFTSNTNVVSLNSKVLGWWKFVYINGYFCGDSICSSSSLNYPSGSEDGPSFESCYLLLISVYRNLTSDQPLITDKIKRQEALLNLLSDFRDWLRSSRRSVSSEQNLGLFIDVCCTNAFWGESMTDLARRVAVSCLCRIWMDVDVADRFPFTECHDLSPVYQWCSRDFGDSDLSEFTHAIYTLLFMPQNRKGLCEILSNDPKAVPHLLRCFRNLTNRFHSHSTKKIHISELNDPLEVCGFEGAFIPHSL